jgi:ankyrin repeat protein
MALQSKDDSQNEISRVVQQAMEDIILAGQAACLKTVSEKLQAFEQLHPESVEKLLRHAIDHQRTESFEALVKVYAQKTVLQGIRRAVIEMGTGGMLRALVKTNKNPADTEELAEEINRLLERDDDPSDALEILLSEANGIIEHERYFDLVTDALAMANWNNKPECVALAMRSDADLNRRTIPMEDSSSRVAPLYYAAYHGYKEVVLNLVAAGADIESQNTGSNWRPLHAATANPDILRHLLEHGADLETKTDLDMTPLMIAVHTNQPKSTEVLLPHSPGPNLHVCSETESMLTLAVESGNPRLVHMLLDAGMNPSHKLVAETNKYVLHKVVKQRQVDVLRRLLLYNLSVNVEEDGDTPLHCIRSWSDTEIIRLLVYRGADVDHRNSYKSGLLDRCVRYEQLEMARLLVQLGADPDARLKYYSGTPMHLACYQSSVEMIDMLVKEGSTMGTHAGSMGAIFQAACQRKDSARGVVLEYLLNAPGFDPTKSNRHWGSNLATACLLTDIGIVKRLVELKVDINEEDILGRRPIHFALYKELELVEYLCVNGADIFDLDLMERNALHFAVASGRLDVVKYTLDVNPDFVHAADCDGLTPIFWAVRECLYWDTETNQRGAIIEELIARGASITIQTQGLDRQWTPLN